MRRYCCFFCIAIVIPFSAYSVDEEYDASLIDGTEIIEGDTLEEGEGEREVDDEYSEISIGKRLNNEAERLSLERKNWMKFNEMKRIDLELEREEAIDMNTGKFASTSHLNEETYSNEKFVKDTPPDHAFTDTNYNSDTQYMDEIAMNEIAEDSGFDF
jgi:hypothetical protein